MERIIIDSFEEISEAMLEDINSGAISVSFVGLYDDAATVIKSLLAYDVTNVYHIEIEPEDWDGYDKEWLVTLDDDYNIWCEKLYRETGYLGFEGNTIYVADDCNSSCLKGALCDEMYEVGYDDECEPTYANECSTVVKTDDGKVVGFTKSWACEENGIQYYHTMSHYSSDEAFVKDVAEKFNIKLK